MTKFCERCGRPAIYRRSYSGEELCTKCFKKSLVEKVQRTISKYRMLKHGDFIAVAVSGGKDSLSLLTMLSEFTQGHSSNLSAVAVDEGISGYRDEALEYCRMLTEKLGLELKIVSFRELYGFTLDEALQKRVGKVSSCALCGVLRRRAIDTAARRLGANVVATAHNLDDFIQTLHINLLNNDVERLAWLRPTIEGSPEFPFKRVKPFVEIYEAEVALYAYLNGIPFQKMPCPYRDEGVRSDVREWLNKMEEKHPGVKYSELRTALTLASGLKSSRIVRIAKCERCGAPSSGKFCSVCQMLRAITN